MENKNKYYDIAERIYDLDGEVYECVGSSLGCLYWDHMVCTLWF